MGYFNIFYKITRIIDMLTRKRNRKAIMVILIIIAIVFLYHNKVNAQEDDLTYNQQYIHFRARLQINGNLSSGTIFNTGSNTTEYYHCNVFPVKEGFTYKASCETSPGDSALKVAFVSTLEEIQFGMHLVESTGGSYYDYSSIPLIGYYNSTAGFEYTATTDGFLIVGGFKDTSDYGWNDSGFKVYTNYNGQSNLNTINQDLLRIEELLKDYLYGDVDAYSLSFNTIQNLAAPWDHSNFISTNGYNTLYFKIRNGYKYKITFNTNYTDNAQAWGLRYGICDNIPSTSNMTNTFNLWSVINYDTTIEYNSTQDCYFYITYLVSQFNSFNITSNYNEGQELGLYGGLTDINNQTRQQGEQTRETITNTDIPTNEMTIDTSIVDGVSNTDNDNFLTSIINRFQGVISPSATVATITIPIPKTGKNIVLRSDLLSRHVANTVIGTYITVFWYVVFFIYFFKFAYRVINWIITGEIIEKPSAFMKYLMDQNAIITASMM